ncbi:hypothetical protein Bhyg_01375 [Pseudolycoriella hygida]|uniref:Uncharacterized protein n=1 Tax=Pseudolycoriella hygida TaxID=35572 RepID=A0A9Q0S5S0_9DIPT|nr:hypothetical protein Bhyg_01375 [Pseudolycoriella hygida]
MCNRQLATQPPPADLSRLRTAADSSSAGRRSALSIYIVFSSSGHIMTVPGSTGNSTGEEIVEVDGTCASSPKIAKLSESDAPPPIGFSFTRAPIIETV